MPDRETWRFINSFAPWFSALGTLAAVIVSLYLARRAARPKIGVSVAITRMAKPGQSTDDLPPFLRIGVVNRGFREVVLIGVMWKQLGWRKQRYVDWSPANAYSKQLPTKLQHGEEAQLFFQTDTFPTLAMPLLKTLSRSTRSSFKLRLLRVGVYASTGEEFLSSLDEHIREWLVQQAKAISA